MSADIQRARDVLQRWRDDSDGSSPGAWKVDSSVSIFPTVRDQNRGEVVESLLSEDARLIVGTAGNPDLLDAIDGMLEWVESTRSQGVSYIVVASYAERIAATVIAADDRMSR